MKSKSAIYILALLFFAVIIVLIFIYGAMKPIFSPKLEVDRPVEEPITIEEKRARTLEIFKELDAQDTRTEKEKAKDLEEKRARTLEIFKELDAQSEISGKE